MPLLIANACMNLNPTPQPDRWAVRIGVVEPLGIENGYGGWQYGVGHMVVADDKVDAFLLGIRYFFYRLDAAV